MFEREKGFAFATHDEKWIEEAIEPRRTYHTKFEFQMLTGTRDKKKLQLVKMAYRTHTGRSFPPVSKS